MRLRTRPDYRRTLSQGKRIFTRRFILFVRKGEGECPRLGVTVSRKVGNAVRRNRIKRCVREAFRTHPGWFGCPQDLVVIAKNPPRDGGTCPWATEPIGTDGIADEIGHALERIFPELTKRDRASR